MPVLTTAALAALAIEGGVQAAKVISKNRKTDLDRRNAERLAELKRREELDLLGLTDAEEAVMRTQQEQSRLAAKKALDAERSRALAATGGGSGASLAMALQAEQDEMEGQQAIGESIAEADLAEKAREEDELEELIAAIANRQAQKRRTRAGALEEVGDVAQAEMLFARTTAQGDVAADIAEEKDAALEEATLSLMRTYNIERDEAERLVEWNAANPHLGLVGAGGVEPEDLEFEGDVGQRRIW